MQTPVVTAHDVEHSTGQAEHEEAFAFEYVPDPQLEQAFAPAFEYVPAEHP